MWWHDLGTEVDNTMMTQGEMMWGQSDANSIPCTNETILWLSGTIFKENMNNADGKVEFLLLGTKQSVLFHVVAAQVQSLCFEKKILFCDKFRSVHLSNVAVQENYLNGKRSEKLPENNFMTSDQFREYLE